MTIAQQLTEDMKVSMKAGQADRTGTLRLLRAAVKNEEIKLGHLLEEAEVLKLLQREAKQRRDSIAAYRGAGREDLAGREEMELAIVQEYLPETMPDDELARVVDEVIAGMGQVGVAQKGMVIGEVMKRVGARADGGVVARLVSQRLAV